MLSRVNNILLYIILWVVYNLQELLHIQGVIGQLLLFFLLAHGFWSWIWVNTNIKKGPYIKIVNIVLLLNTIYGVLLILSGEKHIIDSSEIIDVSNINYLKAYYVSLLPIYSFYYLNIISNDAEKRLNYIVAIFVVGTMLMFYQNFNVTSILLGKEEITNNMGYYFLPLIPLSLYVVNVNKIVKLILFLVIMIFIIASLKRGAILISIVLAILCAYRIFKVLPRKYIIFFMLFLMMLLLVSYHYLLDFYDSSDLFQRRLEGTMEGNSGGRDENYTLYLLYFLYKTPILNFIFGYGADGTLAIFRYYAHNDWLEIAINMGLLGLIVYFLYWTSFYFQIKSTKNELLRWCLSDIWFIYFLASFFSMSIVAMPTAAAFCIAYCLSTEYKKIRICLYKRGHGQQILSENQTQMKQ